MKEITASELRLGNTILLQGKPVKVNLTTLARLLYPDIEEHQQFKGWYSPLTLTEQILIELGFVHEIGDYFHLGDHFFGVKLLKGKFTFPSFWHIEIKHVHQLQNLYHSLTRHELSFTKELEK